MRMPAPAVQRELSLLSLNPYSLSLPLGSGRPLDAATRKFFEPRFGHDLNPVRIHADHRAAEASRALNARAYTVGRDIAFGAGQYAPETARGRRLLAHELVHTVQQSAAGPGSSAGARLLQRTIGDGHDLSSPRFAGDPVLEACFDNERLLRFGNRGAAVQKIQQALIDLGFPLPKFGADGIFGAETKSAVEDFQFSSGASVDGIVGPITMGLLDERFLGTVPPVPQPRAGVFVEPEGEADDVRAVFTFLCPEGNFALDGNRITSNCPGSAFGKPGCSCLCQATKDTKRTFLISVEPVVREDRPDVTLHNGEVVLVPFLKGGFPNTSGSAENPLITMPASTGAGPEATDFGGFEFGLFARDGGCFAAPKWRILAHELCGHGLLKQRSPLAAKRGCRPAHDVTIITENGIAKEHGDPSRGTFETPRQGESFVKLGGREELSFSLADGEHFETCDPVQRARNFNLCR
jgi:hypothetical protein